MSQLGAEWRRREGQRQQLMKQKVEHYTALEQQLQEGLEKLQSQQKVLQGQELKVGMGMCTELNAPRISPLPLPWFHIYVAHSNSFYYVQLISAAFEHSVLRVQEIYVLEKAVFYIAVYGPFKP